MLFTSLVSGMAVVLGVLPSTPASLCGKVFASSEEVLVSDCFSLSSDFTSPFEVACGFETASPEAVVSLVVGCVAVVVDVLEEFALESAGEVGTPDCEETVCSEKANTGSPANTKIRAYLLPIPDSLMLTPLVEMPRNRLDALDMPLGFQQL
jgi:hypothetical protein